MPAICKIPLTHIFLSRRLIVVSECVFACVVCLFLKFHSRSTEHVLEEPGRPWRSRDRTGGLEVRSGEPGRWREISHVSWPWWLVILGKWSKNPGEPLGLCVGWLGRAVPWPRQQMLMEGRVWGSIEMGLRVTQWGANGQICSRPFPRPGLSGGGGSGMGSE